MWAHHLIAVVCIICDTSDFHGVEGGKAVELARSTDFDVAILDVNLNGKMITPVVELIHTRGLPIIFATGYGAARGA